MASVFNYIANLMGDSMVDAESREGDDNTEFSYIIDDAYKQMNKFIVVDLTGRTGAAAQLQHPSVKKDYNDIRRGSTSVRHAGSSSCRNINKHEATGNRSREDGIATSSVLGT